MAFCVLRWLVILAPLGSLGFIVPSLRPLTPLAIFWLFVVFWLKDERGEKNLGRAAVVAFAATVMSMATAFVVLAVTKPPHVELPLYALVVTNCVSAFSFIAAYLYYEYRGQ